MYSSLCVCGYQMISIEPEEICLTITLYSSIVGIIYENLSLLTGYVCMYVCGFISRNPYSLSSHEARIISIWNSLSDYVVASNTVNTFEHGLDKNQC